MIPILFEKTATTFTTNGLGRLADCIRCVVTEGRNDIYECEFDYPVTGVLFDYIQEGRIIACTHDEEGDIQPFDIYARSEPINGVVTFNARHISYRLTGQVVKPFTSDSCVDALAKIKSQSVISNPFTFWTDKSVTATLTSDIPKSARSLLCGEEGSILDVFGTGEYEFDKFDVKLHLHRGQDTNVSIRYGKNLIDLTNQYDTGDIYTAVVPFWLGPETVGDETVTSLVVLPEWYLSSGESAPGGREILLPMDLSSEFEDKPTESALRSVATSRLNNSEAWLPTQTITVNFVQLWQTEEYKEFTPLQRLKLCDTCGVFVPMYNLSLRAKVIKVVYNVLLDRYDEMELGDKPTTYAAVLGESFDSKVADIQQGLQAIKVDIQNVEQKAKDYTDAGLEALESDLEAQIDAKLETWAQSTDPATSWTTATLKQQHNGDLWLYTGLSDLTVNGVTIVPQGVYQYNSSTNKWEAYSSTTDNLFDLVDGKTTIYYGSPSGSYTNKEVGDYLVDSTDGTTYRWSGTAWVKVTDYKTYTDNQIASAKSSIEAAYEQAIEDATELIRGGTGGYIVTTVNANGQPIELLITDNINLNQAVNVWRWNLGGLAHSSNGYNGPFNDVAITQDGKINASMILTGALTANLITAGTITDSSGKNTWNLDSGEFTTKKGQIADFTITNNAISYDNNYYKMELLRRSLEFYYTDGYALDDGGVREEALFERNFIRFRKIVSTYDDTFALSLAPSTYPEFNLSWYGEQGSALSFRLSSVQTYPILASRSVYVSSSLTVAGTKSRVVKTDNYSDRLHYCYETPTPLFGDIGEAVIDEEGVCCVDIDDIFTETIAEQAEYQVFLQKEGEGDCWIADKTPRYFVIQGTPNLKVAWELKAKQRNYESIRLELCDTKLDEYGYNTDDNTSLDEYIKEQEDILYG